MKTLFNLYFILCTITCCLMISCSKDDGQMEEPPPETAQHSMGWNKSKEDLSKFPREVSFKFSSSGSQTQLPQKIDLRDKLPPVGDQGQYGTCVTWSVGYGLRTYLNAVSRKLTPQQLSDKRNQLSPTDLWMAMSDKDKGEGCNGSNFEPAFDVLLKRGIATMQTAPYSSIQCAGSPPQSWTKEAGNNKILNYRSIAEKDMTVDNLKSHLAKGQAISFGARLGDNFMAWNGNGVLSSETYLQPNMQHAYHAIVLAGYDDSKGAGGAFLVYNSWSEAWGDNGFIWIDYDFFLNNFVFCAFVATVDNNVKPNDDKEIDPDGLSTGADLAAYHAYDTHSQSGQGMNRRVYFNIYNVGTSPITPSARWNVIYMYYNAFDANDYGILSQLYFTDEVQQGEIRNISQSWVAFAINKNVPSGKNIAASVFNQSGYEYLYIDYYLPPITGYYYMVVMADPFGAVQEINKQNNLFFITTPAGYPYYFQRGIPRTSAISRGSNANDIEQAIVGKRSSLKAGEPPLHSPVTPENKNAYTPDEIRNMIIRHKQSGELDKKVRQADERLKKSELGGIN